MRREKNEINKSAPKKKLLNYFARLIGILFLLGSVLFVGTAFFANIVSFKYIAILCAIVVLLLVLLLPPLISFKFKKGRKIAAIIISLILLSLYAVLTWYVLGTLGFIDSITNNGMSVEEKYYVVVRDDDTYADIDDIEGETIYSFGQGDDFDEAQGKLKEIVDVDLVQGEQLMPAADSLLAGELEVLFMHEDDFQYILSGAPNFEDDTKILKVISVFKNPFNVAKPVNVSQESFNIMITGIDTEGPISTDSRSDVNMVMTVNPNTHKILLTSIPRDAYIQYPEEGDGAIAGYYDKLTHSGIYGADETIAIVEDLLDIDINYYVKVNYTTVIVLIDEMGGIDVESEYAFYASDNIHSYVEGINHLDGAAALMFARERQSFSDGDFQRNRNQQAVLKAILEKATSSTTILLNYTQILNSLGDYIEMNMTGDEIKELMREQTDEMPSWTIETQNITGECGSAMCYGLGNEASVVFLNDTELANAKSYIETFIENGVEE